MTGLNIAFICIYAYVYEGERKAHNFSQRSISWCVAAL